MDAARSALLAANWKSNHRWEDCESYAAILRDELPQYFDSEEPGAIELLVCPPFPYITVLGSLFAESTVLLGAQDVSRVKEGPHTGEVSAQMVSDIGCDFCIVGHSERRAAGEDDAIIAQKLHRCSEAELIPILCIGESAESREFGMARGFVVGQLDAVREQLLQFPADGLAIAYEPIWAIGTGVNAEPEDAQLMAAEVRVWLATLGAAYAEKVPVLYGGSVNPENLGGYLQQPDIDGALIGGASLEAKAMAEMVRVAEKLRQV
jgi:triosephosphate isomerase (TIM)